MQIVVQHHPARDGRRLADALCARLITDRGGSTWRTYRRCLQTAHDHAGDHICILQDDVLVCDGFEQACDGIIEAVPERIVCLFHGELPLITARTVYLGAEARETLVPISAQQWLPLVGVIWPARLAIQCAAEIGDRVAQADDALVGRWSRKHPVVVAVPNLVQHPDDQQSLIVRYRPTPRRSMCWIGDHPASSIVWAASGPGC